MSTGTKSRSRCSVCNKKVKIVNRFACKCSLFLCKMHRYPDQHGCTYDYKQEQRSYLEGNLKYVGSDKITLI